MTTLILVICVILAQAAPAPVADDKRLEHSTSSPSVDDSAAAALCEILQKEEAFCSRTVKLRLSFSIPRYLDSEQRDVWRRELESEVWLYVRFTSTEEYDIVIYQQGTCLRAIRSTKGGISTGEGTYWHKCFRFPDGSDTIDDDITEQLENLLWPYDMVVEAHLFPVSCGLRVRTCEQLRELYSVSGADSEHGSYSNGASRTLEVSGPGGRSGGIRELILFHEDTLWLSSQRYVAPPCMSGFYQTYESPIDIPGIGCVAARMHFGYRTEMNRVGWELTSTLDPLLPDPPDECIARLFDGHGKHKKYMCKYSSHMKQAWADISGKVIVPERVDIGNIGEPRYITIERNYTVVVLVSASLLLLLIASCIKAAKMLFATCRARKRRLQ